MRKLSREDYTKSQSYVDEGSRETKASLIILTSWQLKLVPREVYLAKKDDDAAILQLALRISMLPCRGRTLTPCVDGEAV